MSLFQKLPELTRRYYLKLDDTFIFSDYKFLFNNTKWKFYKRWYFLITAELCIFNTSERQGRKRWSDHVWPVFLNKESNKLFSYYADHMVTCHHEMNSVMFINIVWPRLDSFLLCGNLVWKIKPPLFCPWKQGSLSQFTVSTRKHSFLKSEA